MTSRPRYPDLTDTALIRRFLEGDEQSFRALYQRHTPKLRMLILRLLGGNAEDADDVVQETWLAACRGIHRFSGDSQFSTWLTTIGIRSARGRLSIPEIADGGSTEFLPDATPYSTADRIDLERALAVLPDHQRAIVVLHDVEGFTHAEIAERLGIPEGTSKVTLSRARAALRRLLSEGAIV